MCMILEAGNSIIKPIGFLQCCTNSLNDVYDPMLLPWVSKKATCFNLRAQSEERRLKAHRTSNGLTRARTYALLHPKPYTLSQNLCLYCHVLCMAYSRDGGVIKTLYVTYSRVIQLCKIQKYLGVFKDVMVDAKPQTWPSRQCAWAHIHWPLELGFRGWDRLPQGRL